ncbi:acyl-CoA dehydrogenase family protein [Streptosporangium sp. NPDC051022]|uniref:acyl-CoA dehydrogenase family protein n=1 Tax=Streptosporangium sp. NPDC051022 TaxID=3155752 RepID=UPI00343B9BA3
MDLQLTTEQRALDEAAAKMLARRASAEDLNDLTDGQAGYDPDLFAEMSAMGWLDLAVEPHGPDGTLVELGLVHERLGEALVPGPFHATASAILTLARLGDTPEATALLTRLTDGGRAALAVLRDGSVEATDAGFTVSGHASGVEWAVGADVLLAAAPYGGSWLILEVPAGPGAGVAPVTVFDYERAGRVALTGARAHRVGEVSPAAWADHTRLLGVLRAAEIVGCGQRALDLAVAHVKQRNQFGRPIGSFQAVQHQCADMVVDLDASRLLVRYALWRAASGLPFARHAAMATWFTGEAMERVTRSANQVHGGVGVIKEYPLHHCYRHAKAQQLRLGSRREQLADLGDLVVADATRDFAGEFVRWPVGT